MKMLPVDDTGSLETIWYSVKLSGFNVVDPEACCDLAYAPIPAAATVTTARRTQRRCFGGADLEVAWRLKVRGIEHLPYAVEGELNKNKPRGGILGFMGERRQREAKGVAESPSHCLSLAAWNLNNQPKPSINRLATVLLLPLQSSLLRLPSSAVTHTGGEKALILFP